MSDRTEKAHTALAHAHGYYDTCKASLDDEANAYLLLRIAEVQAEIAQAEATEALVVLQTPGASTAELMRSARWPLSHEPAGASYSAISNVSTSERNV